MPPVPTRRRSALPWVDVAADFAVVLDELDSTLKSIEAARAVAGLRREVTALQDQAAAPALGDAVAAAQALPSKLSYLQADLRRVEELRRRLDDAGLLHEMAAEENDEATAAEAERELVAL